MRRLRLMSVIVAGLCIMLETLAIATPAGAATKAKHVSASVRQPARAGTRTRAEIAALESSLAQAF